MFKEGNQQQLTFNYYLFFYLLGTESVMLRSGLIPENLAHRLFRARQFFVDSFLQVNFCQT